MHGINKVVLLMVVAIGVGTVRAQNESAQRGVTSPDALGSAQTIRPKELWLDNRGRHIQAHGGGVIRVGDTFYWFGEDRAPDNPPGKRYVSCYASKDLVNWTHRGQVLSLAVPVLERPKVFYNARTRKFVMYMHIDGPKPGQKVVYNYALMQLGTAVCDTVDGAYQYMGSGKVLGRHHSLDISQFVDDDGAAYLLSEERGKGVHIYKLSDDYLSVASDVCLIPHALEGLGLVRFDGLYYLVASRLTGWAPNSNVYLTATALTGPWSVPKDIAPPEKKTYARKYRCCSKLSGRNPQACSSWGICGSPRH